MIWEVQKMFDSSTHIYHLNQSLSASVPFTDKQVDHERFRHFKDHFKKSDMFVKVAADNIA